MSIQQVSVFASDVAMNGILACLLKLAVRLASNNVVRFTQEQRASGKHNFPCIRKVCCLLTLNELNKVFCKISRTAGEVAWFSKEVLGACLPGVVVM